VEYGKIVHILTSFTSINVQVMAQPAFGDPSQPRRPPRSVRCGPIELL